MKVRWVPAALVAGAVSVACAVNVAAAVSPPAAAESRIPFLDPFAVSADGAPGLDGSGAASWRPVAPPAAPAVASADEAAGASDQVASGGEQADGSGTGSAAVPASGPGVGSGGVTPLSHAVSSSGRGEPRTLEAWVVSVSSATGIPARAVQAYGDATLRLSAEGCRVGWPTLAAIGWIESGHGTHGHAVLQADGVPSIPIVGPALDGGAGRAAIRSTPQSVAWHGDPVWDHAVGPMQFIPSTWARWGADGDGDGVANPQDIDDAALAAGRYLCAGGRDLSTWDGWHAAVLSYNHSEAYVQSVFARAGSYAAAVRP